MKTKLTADPRTGGKAKQQMEKKMFPFWRVK